MKKLIAPPSVDLAKTYRTEGAKMEGKHTANNLLFLYIVCNSIKPLVRMENEKSIVKAEQGHPF